MADHPEAEQSTTSAPVADRTSALVASGLVALAVLGVVTVFSDAIGAAWSPNASSASGATATATAPSPSSSTPAAGDGGPA